MSSSSKQETSGEAGLLSGARARSYGSLVQSGCSPMWERRIEHQVKPEDTLQGLALKYGVTMEQIKRANRLYTGDSIFLRKSLHIPVGANHKALLNGLNPELSELEEGAGQSQRSKKPKKMSKAAGDAKKVSEGVRSGPEELSAEDYLRKLDCQISRSKEAAMKKLQEGDMRIPEEHSDSISASAPPTSGMEWQVEHAPEASPRTRQRTLLGPVPLTKTTWAATLRDREDEIFKL
ncbi:lysM and putative peptidoglycan-binding domain-containing protein 1 [Latimeria chalumnae]|uniref:LysM and putative peptidoglycan-binding domain-containing protein 1 n=1 Tax=Latimeria chalumnae TaxID=7897 RepID=H3AV58_LATCH|nr:PREDICTED: lysM and putative peptidoglycan-binding domain-containing protein 1 [Latimeria chalumnae]|eukprot:XP_005996542.1 PREDICTED: lysM and putative peptidoglycan-binding domain-containing protein 1 [Latimeria chalumnae]